MGINATRLLRWAATFTNFAEQGLHGWSSKHLDAPCIWTGITCRNESLYSIDLSGFNLTLGMTCPVLSYQAAAAASLRPDPLSAV